MKKFCLLLLVLILGFFVFTSAENRTNSNDSDGKNTCKLVNHNCCRGELCMQTNVMCSEGFSPVGKGCDQDCMPIVSCEKIYYFDGEILKKKKIDKIGQIIQKIDSLVKYLDTLEMDSYGLKKNIDSLNTLRNRFYKSEISLLENKQYNEQLKNILQNIRGDMTKILLDLK